jgi:hypothetical protein
MDAALDRLLEPLTSRKERRMDTYRPSVPTVRRYPAGVAARLGHRLRQTRLWTLVVAIVLVVVWLSGTAVAAETRERLAGDEGRANFSVTDPEDSCLTHEIWLSALVGEHMPLSQAGGPSDVSWVRATDHVIDTCTETEVEYFDGIVVDLPPEQIELERLESVSVHNVTVGLWSEAGNTLSLTFDLTWTPSGSETTFIYNVGGSEALQVERYVPAEVTGSAVMNQELVIPGQPWSGEISHLTQIGRPTTVSPPDTNSHPTASPEFVGTGWNNAGVNAHTEFDNGGEAWNLEVFVSYVYTDFLRYSDGTIVKPHTDVYIALCAYPLDGGDCGTAPIWEDGGRNLQGSTDASFIPLTSATLNDVGLDVGECGSDPCPLGAVALDLEWEAYGDRSHDVSTESTGIGETWRRQANVTGTIYMHFPSAHPLSVFNSEPLVFGSNLVLDGAEISHSNAGIAFGG